MFGIDRAESIIHDAKFLQSYIPTWYEDSGSALTLYLLDPTRKKARLYDEMERLKKVFETADTADERDRAALDLKVIDTFLANENAFGLSALGFTAPKRCAPLLIEGVFVSVQPDLLIEPLVIGGVKKVGALSFRLSKGIDPESAKKKETQERRREQRREIGRYSALLASMVLEEHFSDHGEVSPEHCIAIDVPLGERVPLMTSDRAARTKRLRKACRQIAQWWPNIEPKPSICA